MIKGFQLRALRVTGRGKPPAEVLFAPGFNVISGASNTGKSYILQCINFMTGGSTPPKQIKESVGYELVVLEIEDNEGQIHQLERDLSGGDFRHKVVREGSILSASTLGGKHSPDKRETISALLLELCGGWGLKVRQNQSGKTRMLSFRDIARFTLVEEQRIIDDESPALTGQHSKKPEDISIFKLLMTGVDASGVTVKETPKENSLKRAGQVELLARLIEECETAIESLDKEPASAQDRRKKLDEAMATHSEILAASREEIAELEESRRTAWERARKLDRKQAATDELRSRFSILESHYRNDLARLQSIIEADHYFSQLRQVRCPLCGAGADQHHTAAHDEQNAANFQDVRIACAAEVKKINGFLRDLTSTTTQLDAELSVLRHEYSEQASLFDSLTQEVMTRLTPSANKTQIELDEIVQARDSLVRVELLQAKLAELQAERDRIAKSKSPRESKAQNLDMLSHQAAEAFSLKVQGILEAWKYPGLKRVTFSDKRLDLIISGKERSSEGKGFRAITFAAFMIGILEHCYEAETELPHPGLVVLDSPLVTYKRRDTEPGEAIPEDVAAAFYQALAKLSPEKQVIVLENNDPPATLHDKIRYTHFSRSAVGRYGFFPTSEP